MEGRIDCANKLSIAGVEYGFGASIVFTKVGAEGEHTDSTRNEETFIEWGGEGGCRMQTTS